MSLYLIAQLIGVCAVLISLSVFQVNKRSVMLKLGMTAAVLYSVHFLLLGATTGAAMNIIGAVRCYVFYHVKPGRGNVWILATFVSVAAVATAFTWQGPLSLLAMLGSMLGATAFWQTNPKIIRRIILFVPPLWFSYNTISGSYPGMFIEVVMFFSNLVGQYRFDFKHRAHTKRHLARPF